MSSNPSEQPEHDGRRPLTLSSKLIAGFVIAIGAVSAVIGIVTQVFLSDFLIKQLDSRVQATQIRFGGPGPNEAAGPTGSAPRTTGRTHPLETQQRTDSSGSATVGRPNAQPDDSVIALADNGTVSSAALRGAYPSCTQLTPVQAAGLATVAPGRSPVTVTLHGFGGFRVMATTVPNGNVLVSGLSTADVEATQGRLTVIMLIVAGSAVVIGGVAIWLIVRRSIRPLERVAATARRVPMLPLDRGEVDLGIRVPCGTPTPAPRSARSGRRSTRWLNQMLVHVSRALSARHESESQVRRFVADASHELRTPLSAIRGYTELAGRNPEDVAAVRHSLTRVHAESERMSSLVDELLLLARLDAGRPLDQVPGGSDGDGHRRGVGCQSGRGRPPVAAGAAA